MASIKQVRFQVGFGRRRAAEKSRSSLAVALALLCGIPFLFVSLDGGDQALCTGHPLGLQQPLAPIRRSNCPPYRRRTASAAAQQRSRAPNSRSHEPDPRILASKNLTSKISRAKSASQILQLVGEEVDGEVFDDYHISASFSRLAKFSQRQKLSPNDVRSSTWPRLVARLRAMLAADRLRARAVANVIWAAAELYEKVLGCDDQLMVELGKAVQLKASSMKAQELSNCLLVAAKLGHRVKSLLSCANSVVKVMPQKAESLKPQEVSNSLWALAKLKSVAPEVLTAVPVVAARIPYKVEGMKPQELSNSLWAAATLQDVSPEVLRVVPALAGSIPYKVEGMKPQELSNSLWAAAQLRDVSPEVLTVVPALAESIPYKVEGMTPQQLANSLWAAAALQEAAPEVLAAVPVLAERIPKKVRSMNNQELSNSLLAASALRDAVPEVLNAVAAIAERISGSKGMNHKDLSDNLAAVGLLKDLVPGVLAAAPALVAQLPAEMSNMTPKQLVGGAQVFVLLLVTLMGNRCVIRLLPPNHRHKQAGQIIPASSLWMASSLAQSMNVLFSLP